MNRGSACVEATLVMPIFIVAMVSIYCMGKMHMTELVVYEAVAECAEYVAENAYINNMNICTPGVYLENYIDDIALVDRYIEGGVDGISFLGSYISNEREVVVYARYRVKISLPFMPVLCKDKEIIIRQRGYVGDSVNQDKIADESSIYVYITDNQEVYHSSRLCTYLSLSIMSVRLENAIQNGYKQCRLCGKNSGEIVYVTEYGERYHSTRTCSGLKRTIYRVKKGEVGGLNECSRCVQNYGYE